MVPEMWCPFSKLQASRQRQLCPASHRVPARWRHHLSLRPRGANGLPIAGHPNQGMKKADSRSKERVAAWLGGQALECRLWGCALGVEWASHVESQRAITQYLEMMSYCANNHESAAHSTHSTPSTSRRPAFELALFQSISFHLRWQVLWCGSAFLFSSLSGPLFL